jgi:DUF4097 and DUF4098 domain-containing protein YvlB
MMISGRKMALMLTPVIAITLAALPAWAEVREEFHKTVAMDANGNFSIKNVNGGITISAWDKNEIEIDAVKTASSSDKLHDARIEVAGSGHSVDVKTKYPSWGNNNGASVEYTIHVPRGARLFAVETVNGGIHIDGPNNLIKAKTVNGKVEVWNASGELQMESVNGELKASLNNAGKNPARLKVVNGSIALSMPPSANARIKVSTVTGGIQSDLPVTVNKPQYGPGASVDATLGSGGATIEVESVNGTIYLHKS